MEEQVILVDEKDRQTGFAGKFEAHRKGHLHRAVSVFIFNSQGELLLQKRAKGKYHSSGLWSNTVCGHPLPGENTMDAANRRLQQEMGMKVALSTIGSFTYKEKVGNGLVEHELDHVYYGISDTVPVPDPSEAEDWKYISIEKLKADLLRQPELYTCWLKICVDRKILGEFI